MLSKLFTVKGHVQGVFFRQSTFQKAIEIDCRGWVKNMPNGDVLIHFMGSESQYNQFKSFILIGPKSAKVRQVEEETTPVDDTIMSFSIRY